MNKINPNYLVLGGVVLIGLYMITSSTKKMYKETLDKVPTPTDLPKQNSTYNKPMGLLGI